MSVFKKIVSMLFEETDTEIIEEDEVETIEFKEKKKPEKPKPVKPQPVVEEIETPRSEPIKHEAVIAEPNEEAKTKFVSIDVEEPAKPTVNAFVRTPLKKAEVKEFEFTPVISPIFGAKEETKKEKKPVSKSYKKPKKDGVHATIISPYFGLDEHVQKEEPKQQSKSSSMQEPSASIEETIPCAPIVMQDELVLEPMQEMNEEIQNYSLDELLAEDTDSNQEDLMQISLFGEPTPVTIDHDGTYHMKE